MANRWWTGAQAGLPVMELESTIKPDHELKISMNDKSANHGDEKGEHRENSGEFKDGPVKAGMCRPRGRPPGSKNKAKPPIFVAWDSPNALRSHIMEVAGGTDISESIAQFARRRQVGVFLLSGSGSVANVTLRQPAGTAVTLRGMFEILSLTGSFFPGQALPGSTGLTVYLAGGQGQVVGGSVVGPLFAVGPVIVTSTTFSSAIYERLQAEDDDEGSIGQDYLPVATESQSLVIGPGVLSNLPDPSSLPMYNLPPNLMPNGGQRNRDAYDPWSHA